MTRETTATNAQQGGNDATARLASSRIPYWDLDLLTPDDVCALLR